MQSAKSTMYHVVTALFCSVCLLVLSGCSTQASENQSQPDVIDQPAGCSTLCKTDGRCTEDRSGDCVATRDEECEGANICLKLGQCVADGGRCIAATEEQCRASSDCGVFGKCGLGDDVCVAVSTEDCIASFWCGSEGFCSLVEGACVVLTDEDCQRSDLCKEYDECSADPGGFCFER